jgi:hypothetical protein
MEKVKITREQADAIVNTLRFNSKLYIVHKKIEHDDAFTTIPNIGTETLIRALYIGYEVEETPEDRVRELYKVREHEANSSKVDSNDRPYFDGICRGIREALDALNIKIGGVN